MLRRALGMLPTVGVARPTGMAALGGGWAAAPGVSAGLPLAAMLEQMRFSPLTRGGNKKWGRLKCRIPQMRRTQWFDRQWKLEILRPQKGPPTPAFPEGVPFEKVSNFIRFTGAATPGSHIKKKSYPSLKRGR